ncbi:MAG: hypothetical protein WBG86_19435 [Polyangiales bacterium]
MARDDPARILFCPYCREEFEGRDECPVHELALVAIDRLPRSADRGVDRVSFFLDPRLGRGPSFVGAGLVLIGFLLPMVRSRGLVASALEIAIDGAHNLWLVPAAAIAILLILARRTEASAMRAARLGFFLLAVGASMPLVYTTRRIAIMSAGQDAEVSWRAGLGWMIAGLLVCAVSSFRLGVPRENRRSSGSAW